ncbi:serine/threonine-protein kinase [Schaalia meyeri]|uniref:serine/threonine-protein kinase n=1 Tax=Schaalia meyeri TaxID=52773 RepID=UPI000B289BD2|nr:serine/threonine-protein kinase [Schaalia meyeri]
MSPVAAGLKGPDIPGFRWVRPLGQGGFADVFLYRQELPSRDVAIKVVRAQGDERGTKELHREADAMTLLSGHPSVVELHGVGTTADGRAYLVMEYCPVADLLTQVRARPMSLETALDMMIKMCGVVETFHWKGYVHRDIKPSNIMLDAYGKPVLADFGVASKAGQLEVGAFDGFSVLWAPPEQQDVSSAASPLQDVWALASTTWTFVTGRSPFEDPIGDNSAASIANRVQRGRVRALGRADAPAELERVLRAAMSVDLAERTQSAKAFGEGLQRVQKELGYPRTEMEIKEKRSKAAAAAVSADDRTRLRGAALIDADATRLRSSSPYSFEGGTGSGGVEAVADSWKSERSADLDDSSSSRVVEEAAATGRGLTPVTGAILALLAAVIAAGLVVGMLRGQGSFTRIAPGKETTTPSAAPGDALGAAPPQVTDLTGEYADGLVAWKWSAPEGIAQSDIVYVYEGSSEGGTSRGRVKETTVSVDASSGENCMQVTTVSRSSGRLSDPVRACVTVP